MADTTIVLGKGTYVMTNEVNLQNVANVHIVGQGIDADDPRLGRASTAQVNGIAALEHERLPRPGLHRRQLGQGRHPRRGERRRDVSAASRRRGKDGADATNGAYGIYPVKSKHVLVEDSVAENASDAGLYVGQCQYVIVRNNEVFGNVAGLEIENTEYADVYGNDVHDNTGGLVIFDLPGNPIVGRDIRVRDNHVHDNNGVNFAPGGTVAAIPVGTGTFAMASRRVEILNNTYERNDTVDIGDRQRPRHPVRPVEVESRPDGHGIRRQRRRSQSPAWLQRRRLGEREREPRLELPQREHPHRGQHAQRLGHVSGSHERQASRRRLARRALRSARQAGRQRRLRHDRRADHRRQRGSSGRRAHRPHDERQQHLRRRQHDGLVRQPELLLRRT